jgi:hypothetical protein
MKKVPSLFLALYMKIIIDIYHCYVGYSGVVTAARACAVSLAENVCLVEFILILSFRCDSLVLIQLLCLLSAWMWAVLPVFWRYMQPPVSK